MSPRRCKRAALLVSQSSEDQQNLKSKKSSKDQKWKLFLSSKHFLSGH